MDLEAKIELVNETKKYIEELITDGAEKFVQYNKQVDEQVKKHNDFIDYIEKIRLVKLYEWKNLKIEYKDLKKKINKDKHIIKHTTQNFDLVINYYSIDEGDKINKKLNEIYEKSDLVLFNYKTLKKIHRYTSYQLKLVKKNDDYVKLEFYDNKMIPIFIKFNEIYMDMKLLNKKSAELKSRKGNLIYEMNQLRKNEK